MHCVELIVLGFGFWGNVFGAYFEQTCLGTHKYKHWYKTSALIRIIRTIVCTAVLMLAFSSSILFTKIFSSVMDEQWLRVWNRAVAFFCGNFAVMGFFRWISFKLNLINTHVKGS